MASFIGKYTSVIVNGKLFSMNVIDKIVVYKDISVVIRYFKHCQSFYSGEECVWIVGDFWQLDAVKEY